MGIPTEKFQELEILLKKYRENTSDYHIALESFKNLENQLVLHKKPSSLENTEEVIQGLAIGAVALSDMPKSITNKINSPTESVAMNYLYYLQPSELEIKAIKATLAEKARTLHQLNHEITLVDNLLISLTDKESFIIKNIYFKGFTATQVMWMFNNEFHHCMLTSIKSIFRMKYQALEKMLKRLR